MKTEVPLVSACESTRYVTIHKNKNIGIFKNRVKTDKSLKPGSLNSWGGGKGLQPLLWSVLEANMSICGVYIYKCPSYFFPFLQYIHILQLRPRVALALHKLEASGQGPHGFYILMFSL